MKRSLAVLALAIGLSACGSHAKLNVSSDPQAQAAVAKADQVITKCLPNPLALASHGGRVKFRQCAVPPNRQQAFAACLERVVLSGIPTKARLKNGATDCLQKVQS